MSWEKLQSEINCFINWIQQLLHLVTFCQNCSARKTILGQSSSYEVADKEDFCCQLILQIDKSDYDLICFIATIVGLAKGSLVIIGL